MRFFITWKNDGLIIAFLELRDNLTYPFYRFWEQTKTIISYLPVLWKDRDWDWFFILYLLRHKLNRMQKKFQKGMHVGCEVDAQRMRTCIRLIDRILKNDYYGFQNPYYWEQRDWDVLFKILHKKMRGWWD